MPRESVQAPKRVQLLFVEASERDQHRIQRRRVVALRREEQIALIRSFLEVAQLVQKYPAHDVERAEARAEVARPGLRDHVERVDAAEGRERARVVDRIEARRAQPREL